MAAQKLTRGRLIQIIVLMIVLITAFIWRTVTYQKPPVTTNQAKVCNLNTGNCTFTIDTKPVTISLLPLDPKANIPLQLHISNIAVNPRATVNGISMNMGILPVIFKQQKEGWLGEFTVPQCTADKMTWAINIKINNNIYTSEFTVTK